MRSVLDTCVLVAAFRNRSGSSYQSMEAALRRSIIPLVSVPLVLEYEAVLTRPEHLAASGYSAEEAVRIVKAFCSVGEQVHLRSGLRPLLTDPADEFVMETAIFGRADAIVTFNKRHFEAAAQRLKIAVISPREALERLVQS